MNIVVQKFGGTSVATSEARQKAVAKIKQMVDKGYATVVVVSAMGRQGEPYATDTMLNLVKSIHKTVSPREQDLLLSCGEIISTVVMAHDLEKAGIGATAMTGKQAGILTDERYGEAQILSIDPTRLLEVLKEGKVAVVAGFQGATSKGDITTLGRGGSDTTATALGAALNAEVVEIYTDVNGVMTVDPRLVPQAKILPQMTYREICEMANQGAKVVHPKAVAIAQEKKVPVKIKSTFSEEQGTLITEGKTERIITGLAHQAGLALARVNLQSSGNGANKVNILKGLAAEGISVDMINMSPEMLQFVINKSWQEKTTKVLQKSGFEVEWVVPCAKISLIGVGMQDVPGIIAKVAEILNEAKVPIIHSTDSEITISCLVPEDKMAGSLTALHDGFNL